MRSTGKRLAVLWHRATSHCKHFCWESSCTQRKSCEKQPRHKRAGASSPSLRLQRLKVEDKVFVFHGSGAPQSLGIVVAGSTRDELQMNMPVPRFNWPQLFPDEYAGSQLVAGHVIPCCYDPAWRRSVRPSLCEQSGDVEKRPGARAARNRLLNSAPHRCGHAGLRRSLQHYFSSARLS